MKNEKIFEISGKIILDVTVNICGIDKEEAEDIFRNGGWLQFNDPVEVIDINNSKTTVRKIREVE